MGLGDLGQLGDIGGIVVSSLALFIAAIVLLTFAPGIAGDIDGIALLARSEGRCEYIGEAFPWLLKGTATQQEGAEAWGAVTGSSTIVTFKKSTAGALCSGSEDAAAVYYYTPKGTAFLGVADMWKADGSEGIGAWKDTNKSLTALGGGSIALLLFGATAILIPAGAIGFLGYFGARFVAQNIGGGPLAVGIGATIIVVLAGALLPQVFDPLDKLYLAIDGNRFWVFSQGIGKIGEVIGNFLGISLLGGIVTLGTLLWKGVKGGGSMSQAM